MTTRSIETTERQGVIYAIGAYGFWGLFPIYWKLLKAFPAPEILSHRILWSFVFYSVLQWKTSGGPRTWIALLSKPRTLFQIAVATFMLSCNWLLYIWSVNNGHVVDASLGYFITPLFNILMGRLILNERITPSRWAAVGFAVAGVLYLIIQAHGAPWIALGLATSFSTYGLIRKRIQTDVLSASCAETSLLAIPALIAILYFRVWSPESVHASPVDGLLLIGSGVITGLPLIWFANAARALPLSKLGFFQYLTPSIQFALGLLAYGEPFSLPQFQAFLLIWMGLFVFSYDSLRRRTA